MDSSFWKQKNTPLIIAAGIVAVILFGYYLSVFLIEGGFGKDTSLGQQSFEEERLGILAELEKNSPPPPTSSQGQQILEELEKQSQHQDEVSETERAEILEVLEAQQ